MSKIIKKDDELEEVKLFVKYILNNTSIKPVSIARSTKISKTKYITDFNFRYNIASRIMVAYYGLYIKWCNDNNKEPMKSIVDYMNNLYKDV